jgi:S-(hydroxymethyl)glutathione dehydrogenase/alcohol dehydrogenase
VPERGEEIALKAAVCYEFGKPLVIDEIDIDPPGRGEVKVRMAATAVCHSDVHHLRGDWGGPTPTVTGHESAGIVEEVGEDVTSIRRGDHVVVSLLRSCGRCFYCTTGAPYFCEGSFVLDNETRLHTRGGEPIEQGIFVGGFAEYVVVDQSQVVPVPKELPLEYAALLACGVITGVGAVINAARVEPGASAVIIGTGGVGLNAVQGAAISGANPIIAVDMLDTKLEAARTFGATHTVNARREDAPQAVRRLTLEEHGADYVFVTVGSTAAVEQGLKMLRKEGLLVALGIPEIDATAPLSVYDLVLKGARVMGCRQGASRPRVDVPRLVGLYQSGRLKLDELITARYPLERINEAIASMERGEALRNVIIFS